MQIKSLRTKSYRRFAVDDTTPADAFERLRRIETVQALRVSIVRTDWRDGHNACR